MKRTITVSFAFAVGLLGNGMYAMQEEELQPTPVRATQQIRLDDFEGQPVVADVFCLMSGDSMRQALDFQQKKYKARVIYYQAGVPVFWHDIPFVLPFWSHEWQNCMGLKRQLKGNFNAFRQGCDAYVDTSNQYQYNFASIGSSAELPQLLQNCADVVRAYSNASSKIIYAPNSAAISANIAGFFSLNA